MTTTTSTSSYPTPTTTTSHRGIEGELGFVTYLNQMLDVKLRDLGVRHTVLWRDRKRVSQGDQFDAVIDDGLRESVSPRRRHVAELDAAPLLPERA